MNDMSYDLILINKTMGYDLTHTQRARLEKKPSFQGLMKGQQDWGQSKLRLNDVPQSRCQSKKGCPSGLRQPILPTDGIRSMLFLLNRIGQVKIIGKKQSYK